MSWSDFVCAPKYLALCVPPNLLKKVRSFEKMQHLVRAAKSAQPRDLAGFRTAILYQLRRGNREDLSWDRKDINYAPDLSSSLCNQCMYNHFPWLEVTFGAATAFQMITYGGLNWQWLNLRTEPSIAQRILYTRGEYQFMMNEAVVECYRYGNEALLHLLRPGKPYNREMKGICDVKGNDAVMLRAKGSMFLEFTSAQMYYAYDGLRGYDSRTRLALAEMTRAEAKRPDSLFRRDKYRIEKTVCSNLMVCPDMAAIIAKEHKVGWSDYRFNRLIHPPRLEGYEILNALRENKRPQSTASDDMLFLVFHHVIREDLDCDISCLLSENFSERIFSILIENNRAQLLRRVVGLIPTKLAADLVLFDRVGLLDVWTPEADFVQYIPTNTRCDPDFAGNRLIRAYPWDEKKKTLAARHLIRLNRGDLLAELDLPHELVPICEIQSECLDVLLPAGAHPWYFHLKCWRAVNLARMYYPSASSTLKLKRGDVEIECTFDMLQDERYQRLNAHELQTVEKIRLRDIAITDTVIDVVKIMDIEDIGFVRNVVYSKCGCGPANQQTADKSTVDSWWVCNSKVFGELPKSHLPYWLDPVPEKLPLLASRIPTASTEKLVAAYQEAVEDGKAMLLKLAVEHKHEALFAFGPLAKSIKILNGQVPQQALSKMLSEVKMRDEEAGLAALECGWIDVARRLTDIPIQYWVEPIDDMLAKMDPAMRQAAKACYEACMDSPGDLSPADLRLCDLAHDFWVGVKKAAVAQRLVEAMSIGERRSFQLKAVGCNNLVAFRSVINSGKFWDPAVSDECLRLERKEMMVLVSDAYFDGGTLKPWVTYRSIAGVDVVCHPLERVLDCKEPTDLICPITQEIMTVACAMDGMWFDQLALNEWLKYRDVNPMTNAAPTTPVIPCKRVQFLVYLFEQGGKFHSFPASDEARYVGVDWKIKDGLVMMDHTQSGAFLTEDMLRECCFTGLTPDRIDDEGNMGHHTLVKGYKLHGWQSRMRQDFSPVDRGFLVDYQEENNAVSFSTSLARFSTSLLDSFIRICEGTVRFFRR